MQVVLAELRTFPKISAQLFFRSGNASVAHRAPGLAEYDGHGRAHRNGFTHEPPNRGRLAAHGSGPGITRRRGFQRDFRFPASPNFPEVFSICWVTWRATLPFQLRNSSASAPAKSRACASSAPRRDFFPASASAAFFSANILMRSSRPRKNKWRRSSARNSRSSITNNYSPANALLIVVGDFSATPCSRRSKKFSAAGSSGARGA